MSTERSFHWTPAGEASRIAAGVELIEVVQAFHSPLRTEDRLRPGTLWLIAGMADSGRVIRLACEPAFAPGVFALLAVGTVEGPGLDEWRARL